MANITHKGNPVTTIGELPKVGSKAPDFSLTAGDLSDKTLANYKGKKKILDISPSLDTGVCQTAARKFNEAAAKLTNTAVLLITADLPWAAKRFCTAENLTNVEHLSLMHDRKFGETYGVLLTSGPMRGTLSRSIVVLDENDTVKYTEQVPETTNEPNYEGALNAVK